MSRHRARTELDPAIAAARALPARHLAWSPADGSALPAGTVQLAVAVDPGAVPGWRWMDTAREAFVAARRVSDIVVELVLPHTRGDALSVLALAPEVVRIPIGAPDPESIAHVLDLLGQMRQFQTVPCLAVAWADAEAWMQALSAERVSARAVIWHVDGGEPCAVPSFAELRPLWVLRGLAGETPSAWTDQWDPVGASGLAAPGAMQGHAGAAEGSAHAIVWRTVDQHRLALGLIEVRDPCG